LAARRFTASSMRPPPRIRQPAAAASRPETDARLWRRSVQNEKTEDACHFRTFEPWLGGDRQTGKHVAKAHNPLQRGCFEVSLS
jgi:hypothetical protein